MTNRARPQNDFLRPDIRDVPVSIYALCEPTGEIRYIGRSHNPGSRLSNHRGAGSVAMRDWLESLAKVGAKPKLMILSVVMPGDDSAAAEFAAIRGHRHCGLLNGERRRKPRRRRKMSAAVKALEGRSLASIGQELGVNASVVCRWMSGDRKPSAELRARIQDRFGVDWRLWDEVAA